MAITAKGYTQLANSAPFNGPAQINAAEAFVEGLVDATVATSGQLPTTGNWVGRTYYVSGDRSTWRYTGQGWAKLGRFQSVDYATGATTGAVLAPGGGEQHAGVVKTPNFGGDVFVSGSIHIWLPGGSAAGALSIRYGGTVLRSRRWHSHNKPTPQWLTVVVNADFSMSPTATASSINLYLSSDSTSGVSVEVWDAELKLTVI